jgi:hypothetical protein
LSELELERLQLTALEEDRYREATRNRRVADRRQGFGRRRMDVLELIEFEEDR